MWCRCEMGTFRTTSSTPPLGHAVSSETRGRPFVHFSTPAMDTCCSATADTRNTATSTTAVKSCHNIVQVACVVLLLRKCRVLGHLTLNNRDRALESIHNVPEFSLRFAEVLRHLFLSRHSLRSTPSPPMQSNL